MAGTKQEHVKPCPNRSRPPPGGPDTQRAAVAWLQSLDRERRLSAKTVEAYGRDLRQFLTFLTGHLGGAADGARHRSPETARHPRLPGGPPRRRHREPLADAPAGGLALFRAASRARGSWNGLGFRSPAQPEGRQGAAAAGQRPGGRGAHRRRDARRGAAGALGPGARRRRAGIALRGGPAHLRGPRAQARGRADPRRGRGDRHRKGQQAANGADHRPDPARR